MEQQLKDIDWSAKAYLTKARIQARKSGYKPENLFFASDGEHKLEYRNGNRISRFGRIGYGDFLIYTYLENNGMVPSGTAQTKKHTFNKSHSAIKGEWKQDRYSPNMLALKILW
jgi:hypothetical protein